jgi:hypothetical protein
MGKRSEFPRIPRDSYPTPSSAVEPLLEHLAPGTHFVEPCCGDGHLVGHLERARHVCVGAYDLPVDARTKVYAEAKPGILIITNPPWARSALHEILVSCSDQAPTWLLLDADWFFTRQAKPFLPRLRKIAVIGRVKWIPDSPFSGKDSCAWALFDRPRAEAHATIRLFGRPDSSLAKPIRRVA